MVSSSRVLISFWKCHGHFSAGPLLPVNPACHACLRIIKHVSIVNTTIYDLLDRPIETILLTILFEDVQFYVDPRLATICRLIGACSSHMETIMSPPQHLLLFDLSYAILTTHACGLCCTTCILTTWQVLVCQTMASPWGVGAVVLHAYVCFQRCLLLCVLTCAARSQISNPAYSEKILTSQKFN